MTDDAPGRLQRSQDARRARVIETVLELLREGGTDSVRLRTVWERTGVGTDTIYRYFGSRDRLISGAIATWLDREFFVPARTWPTGSTPAERLLSICRRTWDVWERDPGMLEPFVRASLTAHGGEDSLAVQSLRAFEPLVAAALEPVEPAYRDDVVLVVNSVTQSAMTAVIRGQLDIREVYPIVERTIHRLAEHPAMDGSRPALGTTPRRSPSPRRRAADPPAEHVDRELAALADMLPRGGGGSGDDPLAARARLREVVAAMGVGTAPAGLTITDRPVPGPAGAPAVPVRVYRPSAGDGPAPALVYFHGGGFVAGDLDSDHGRCMAFAEGAACVVVSVDYRLAPEHRFPAAVEDCFAVLCWLARTDGLGVDRARIGVGGASAGAGLAAAVALMARDRGGPAVAFQMLAAPVLDDRMATASMRFAGTPLFDGPAAAQMWRNYLGSAPNEAEPVSVYAAPARAHDLRDLPETYIMTSELDPLRDEGLEYAVRLLAAGVPVELHHYSGAFHGFEQLPTSLSRRATDEQIEWIRRVAA